MQAGTAGGAGPMQTGQRSVAFNWLEPGGLRRQTRPLGLSSSIRGAAGTTSNGSCKLHLVPLITVICQDATGKQTKP